MLQSYNLLFELMETLGKKWVVPLLIFLLFYESTTFSQLKRHLKVTSRALSKKLKLLEALGLIERVVESPKKVLYTLSEKGRDTTQLLLGIGNGLTK